MRRLLLVCQRHSSSGLPTYLERSLAARGFDVSMVDPSSSLVSQAGVFLRAFRPNKRRWHAERERLGLYSVGAWHRNTALAGRILEREFRDGARVLQIGGLHFPHPDYRQLEYYLFFTYTMRLAMRDGFSPWVVRPDEADEFISLETQLYRNARGIFVSAGFVKDHLVREYGVDASRITVTGMGVDDFYLQNMPASVPAEPSHRCLFVGFTWEIKGGPEVVEAFRRAQEGIRELTLDIAGPPPREEMRSAGIRALGPVRDRDALLQLYRASDLLLLPSRCDSWGFVFLEAMTQGVVCVGSDMNAMPEIIDHGVTGYVVPPGDPEALAGTIVDFYRRQDARPRMAAAAQARVRELFTWSRVATLIEAQVS